MAPKIDPAIVKALGLDPAKTSIAAHGGSGFSTTGKVTGVDGSGKERVFFVKTGKGAEAETMFAGEHASLNAIHSIVPNFCPRSYAHGSLSSSSGSFLATSFLNLSFSSSSRKKGSGLSLAAKLAKLHTTPAPIPDGYSIPQFGFPVTTCCGSTEQDNTFSSSWPGFYANRRLRMILQKSEQSNGKDKELTQLVNDTADKVVPRLLGNLNEGKGVDPVVVHGDLWSGNHSRGTIVRDDGEESGVEEVVFDSSACYAHSEFELGIMKMFGGFGGSFWEEYHKLKPKDEPVGEWEDRVRLYELYHHLNHHAIFGGGYRSGAVSIMKSLIKKYG